MQKVNNKCSKSRKVRNNVHNQMIQRNNKKSFNVFHLYLNRNNMCSQSILDYIYNIYLSIYWPRQLCVRMLKGKENY